MSSKKPTRTEGAVSGVAVLPYGLEGAAMFNQWVEHLIRAIFIVHPGLGDWWTNDEYKALKAYNHAVEVPPEGINGQGEAIPMAPAEAAAYRKREREGRVDKKNKDIDKREEDLPTVYSKLLCLLTPEGIDQFKNLPEWGDIAAAKDPIMLKHAIIKTQPHSRANTVHSRSIWPARCQVSTLSISTGLNSRPDGSWQLLWGMILQKKMRR